MSIAPEYQIRAFLVFLALAGFPAGASAQVVLNELLADNHLSSFDEEGDSEDWVELHNQGSVDVNLAGYKLTDDPLIPEKWTFPDIEIPAHGYLRVWLSGKDRFVPPPEVITGNPGNFAFRPSIIATGEEWRYLIGDPARQGPPAGWNLLGFDDSSFGAGRAGFGFSDDDDYTVLPTGTTTVFIRKVFRVENPGLLINLILQVNFDDGFVAYLNGTRVASEYFGTGNPTFQSVANGSHEAGTRLRYDLTPYLNRLQAGDNVLALVGLNISSGSTDLTLDPELGTIPLVLHANFHLDAAGEPLILRDPAGNIADEIEFPYQTEDHSYGRSPDGTGSWAYLLTPTPEAPNQTLTSPEPFSEEVNFDPEPGKFTKPFQVSMTVEPPGLSEIRYTTDGSEPTAASTLSTGPISVSKNTVFRAAGFIQGERSTRIVSKSYFYGGALALPTISISMNPDDYIKVHTDSWASGRGSERPAYLEYFEGDGTRGPDMGFGLRLHGGAGRDGDINTKKAYKCYFRGSYGAERFVYPFMVETSVADFDKLVLRSGFNDAFRTNGGATYIRDQLIRDLHRDMGALAAHGAWCNLFVNMRYRGVYNVTERMDEDFLESYTGFRDWDVMKTGNDILAGDNTQWERLHNFMIQNDLSQEARYRQALEMIDIENFTGYMILNTWAQNHDWPHNNWYAARRRISEGRWIFLCWDAEFGIGLYPGGYSTDSFEFALNQGGYIRDIFASLLQSPIYREYFIAEVDRHLFFALRSTKVLARIDALQKAIAADMPEEAVLTGNNYNQWVSNLGTLRTFASSRGNIYRNFILNSTRFNPKFPSPPRIFLCDQKRVVNTGATAVRFRGVRFGKDTKFSFDGVPAAATKYTYNANEAIMDVTLPLDLSIGRFPVVAVEDPKSMQSTRFINQLEVLPPVPEPLSLEPSEVDERGGDLVRIQGNYFLEGIRVTIGGVPVTGAVLSGSPPAIEFTAPPGRGEVEVLVANVVQGTELPAATKLRFAYKRFGPWFIRGDSNSDGIIDISDPVHILYFLYTGGASPSCLATTDVDASGKLDLADPIYGLMFLFLDGTAPPPPYPACGDDPAAEPLACDSSPACP